MTVPCYTNPLIQNGAQGRNRTTDTRIFSPILKPRFQWVSWQRSAVSSLNIVGLEN